MFSTLHKTNFKFSVTFILSSANAFNLDQSKILLCGKDLSHVYFIICNYYKFEKSTFLSFGKELIFYHTIQTFNTSGKEAFKNIVGKGENAGNQHFLLSPQCFPSIPKRISVFKLHLFCHLQMFSIWTS